MALHDPCAGGDDAALRIYNIDGSLSAACGNGTRCVAWALAREWRAGASALETDAGLIESCAPARRCSPSTWAARVWTGARFRWRMTLATQATSRWSRKSRARRSAFRAVEHGQSARGVFRRRRRRGRSRNARPRARASSALSRARQYLLRANSCAHDEILLRVWERGTGATKACGSAACATLVAAARRSRAGRAARHTTSGRRSSHSTGATTITCMMTGPVEFEFETTLDPAIFEGAGGVSGSARSRSSPSAAGSTSSNRRRSRARRAARAKKISSSSTPAPSRRSRRARRARPSAACIANGPRRASSSPAARRR